MTDPTSAALYDRACRRLPGGVNSPVRAFRGVGGTPVFIERAHGPYLVGADGREYVDYIGSWGPMILGHAHPQVVSAVQAAMARGASFGAPTELEIRMAELLAELVPSMEMSRLTSSGTEAVMGALRVARGFTGRDLVVKCEGCYHGGADYLLVKAGSGAATLGVPDSAGVPADIAKTTRLVPFNDLPAMERALEDHAGRVAAVIVEPVVGNMGCVPPEPGYLAGLRALASRHGALLVFDEVMTGFRVSLGGAQERFGVTPDLSCFGKIIGGGLPVGAYGGRREIMQKVAPAGPVYQAGTLSGNPLSVTAGLATLELLRAPDSFERLERSAAEIARLFDAAAKRAGVPCCVQRVGSMLTPFLLEGPVRRWDDAARADTRRFGRLHAELLARGVYWPPSQFEAGFVSLAHDARALEITAEAVSGAFAALTR